MTRGVATPAEVRHAGPLVDHPEWRMIEQSQEGAAYRHRLWPMTLIWSVAREEDGRLWQHMSMAHRDRTPTWAELIGAKEWLMGTTTYAYQVAPPRAVYVNEHPNVLHLFRCLDGDGCRLPEFSFIEDGERHL